jgi:hypothetical protein
MPIVPSGPPAYGALCEPWATVEDVCPPCEALDVEKLAPWLDVASSVLYGLTGSQWPGECLDTVWPGPEECYAWLSHRRRDSRPLELPGYPVVDIEHVVIDGVELDRERYRVDDRRRLVYLPEPGGRQGWPTNNDARVAPDAEGTWSVAYWWGAAPPPGGREMAASLGCQLALACDGSDECRLPKRVQTVTRQGITMVALDDLGIFEAGRTGLEDVDAWLGSIRYASAHRPAALFIPGASRRMSRRGTSLT